MIHCIDERDPESYEPDVIINVPLDDGNIAEAGICIRPNLYDILKQLSEIFLLVAFTASE